MYTLHKEKFHSALENCGYSTIGEFAKAVGLHRNTIYMYLSGKRVLPQGFEVILGALDLRPEELLIEVRSRPSSAHQEIAPLVDELHKEFPRVTFILFGSRAQGRAKKYSDWDIGAFSSEGISYDDFTKILNKRDALAENLPFIIDIVNFTKADIPFLQKASQNWIFLAGSQQDWVELHQRVAHA